LREIPACETFLLYRRFFPEVIGRRPLIGMPAISENNLWIVFGVVVVVAMTLDLAVINRKAHVIKIKEALVYSAAWIALALAFNVLIYFTLGSEKALMFLTGYLIEESLSVDNLFVFLLIFTYFQVPAQYQHRVLFWGIIGAVIMRLLFIYAGVGLIRHFHWTIYLFGAFLVFTGIRMAFKQAGEDAHIDQNPVIRLLRGVTDTSEGFASGKFFVRKAGRLLITPLFVVLMVVETTDVLFATDSVPAILGISNDTFIIFSSNIFAILGLRSLYFALAGLMDTFHLLRYGLAFILAFVGAKMLITYFHLEIPTSAALGVIALALLISVLASIIHKRKTETTENKGDP
jgi:tellurite resistance protein TerC